ncbi:unnamed protein product [Ostreobium quekettii]|uniref:BTB domain-containing protein n=1 Tax=Ostreobium quekettii TaxID=121088 RepID=A0A8S1J0Y6_9CHLO|nr:unnamed protein product [Ostreobium quekettii]
MGIDPRYSDIIIRIQLTDTENVDPRSSQCDGPVAKKRRTQGEGGSQLTTKEAAHAGSNHQTPATPEGRCQDFNASKYCLATGSKFFRTMLDRWSQELQLGSRSVLEVCLQAHEMKVFEALLEFIHHKQIPTGLPARELMELLLLADRFLVDGLVGPCVELLISSDMHMDFGAVVKSLCKLECSRLRDAPPITTLLEEGRQMVVDVFESAEQISDPSDWCWEAFLDLPLAAAKHLLMQDGLETTAEEAVFCLVSDWLECNFGPSEMGSDAYCQAALELGACVRFCQMHPFYLQEVVPYVGWMRRLDSSDWWVREALKFHDQRGSPEALESVERRVGCRFRPRTKAAFSHVRLNLYDDANIKVLSDAMRHRGYDWELRCVSEGGINGTASIGLCVTVPHSNKERNRTSPVLPSCSVPKRVVFCIRTTSGIHEVVYDWKDAALGEFCVYAKKKRSSLIDSDGRIEIEMVADFDSKDQPLVFFAPLRLLRTESA